jgi:hypothetical protein
VGDQLGRKNGERLVEAGRVVVLYFEELGNHADRLQMELDLPTGAGRLGGVPLQFCLAGRNEPPFDAVSQHFPLRQAVALRQPLRRTRHCQQQQLLSHQRPVSQMRGGRRNAEHWAGGVRIDGVALR